jgi:hypothetical protein
MTSVARSIIYQRLRDHKRRPRPSSYQISHYLAPQPLCTCLISLGQPQSVFSIADERTARLKTKAEADSFATSIRINFRDTPRLQGDPESCFQIVFHSTSFSELSSGFHLSQRTTKLEPSMVTVLACLFLACCDDGHRTMLQLAVVSKLTSELLASKSTNPLHQPEFCRLCLSCIL